MPESDLRVRIVRPGGRLRQLSPNNRGYVGDGAAIDAHGEGAGHGGKVWMAAGLSN